MQQWAKMEHDYFSNGKVRDTSTRWRLKVFANPISERNLARSNTLANIKGPFRMTRCESKPFLHLEGEKHGQWFSVETFENAWNDANLLFSFGLIMHKGTTNEFSESVSRKPFEYFISDKSTIS